MTDMQRYEGPSIPRDQGSYVLASDAEAAIAAAEQRGHERGANETKEHLIDPISYQQGQRDMLAKCIAAVRAVEGGYSVPLGMSVGQFIDAMRHQFIAAICDLEEK